MCLREVCGVGLAGVHHHPSGHRLIELPLFQQFPRFIEQILLRRAGSAAWVGGYFFFWPGLAFVVERAHV